MRKNNRICIVCSTKYTYCPNCAEFDHLEKWHTIYHDENCKNIFEAASDYLAGYITKEEAKLKLDKCDLSNKANFHHKIVEAIDEVYGTNKENTEKTTETKKSTKSTTKKVEVKEESINEGISEK